MCRSRAAAVGLWRAAPHGSCAHCALAPGLRLLCTRQPPSSSPAGVGAGANGSSLVSGAVPSALPHGSRGRGDGQAVVLQSCQQKCEQKRSIPCCTSAASFCSPGGPAPNPEQPLMPGVVHPTRATAEVRKVPVFRGMCWAGAVNPGCTCGVWFSGYSMCPHL